MKTRALALTLAGSSALLGSLAYAQPISIRDSFRIGSAGQVLCSAQTIGANALLKDMFDRGYAITCRDAAVPVGEMYVLRARDGDPLARLIAERGKKAQCATAGRTQIEGVGTVDQFDCKLADIDVTYRAYQHRKGAYIYSAEGLAGYDSALRMGLQTLVTDSPVEGELSVATTGLGDPAAFARVQAGTLDPGRALAEAYRRNNAGNYAESAEFFAVVSSGESGSSKAEGLVNEALQKSNLGRHAEAEQLFNRAEELTGNDPVVARQLRNYRTMHYLNQGEPKRAIEHLDAPLPRGAEIVRMAISDLVIDKETAKRLNADSAVSRRLTGTSAALLPHEKMQILDAQAQELRGAALRLDGRPAEALEALVEADRQLIAVRQGRLSSLIWMRAQILGERAAIAEEAKDLAEADRLHQASVALLQSDYPGSAALLSARGRRAGFLARNGRSEEASAIFAEIVAAQSQRDGSTPGLARVLAPYVDLLLDRKDDPQAVAALFEASQVLVRPGVAQTQAILARELSAGSDAASRLFRQAVGLSRQIERSRVELSRLESISEPGPVELARIATVRETLDQRQKEQVATQAKLNDYPRFRAVSNSAISIADLREQLRPGEAYYKMAQVDDELIAVFITATTAKAFRIETKAEALKDQVAALRETISHYEQGQHVTYAFDVPLAHHLYTQLFGPVHSELAAVRHLIFEPDGAMLRLPPNLLIMEPAGVEAYRERVARDPKSEFDFTGIAWLGRERDISTAVSARAFRDVRMAPRSTAGREYLGLGQNAVPSGEVAESGSVRGIEADCSLSLAAWKRPISPDELKLAQTILGGDRPGLAQVVTRDDFTDTAIKKRDDLTDYRIIHFATHGIVTSPRPRCPAQPALMTSFGDSESDGLLTFREIFDLRLDADLVILSACDTAGGATSAATEAAGLGVGGEVALDGLVRAFVGAGGRIVIASHWPVPDDYDATKRLISGLFTAPAGTSTAGALRIAQQSLMDDPDTSHPFYWSGFATIGDGSVAVRRADSRQVASR